MNRRTVIVFLVIAIVILLAIGLFNAIRQGTSRPGTPTPTPTAKPVSLLDYVDADDAEARITTIGRIVAKEQHLDETISISKLRRNIYYVRAYSGTADPNLSFDNNQPAYEDFIRALNNAGFTATKTLPKNSPKPADTEAGLCPTGQRYVYEIIKGGVSVYQAFSTSCGDPTTFGGQAPSILQLFKNQIPGYNKIASTAQNSAQQ